MPDQPNLLAQTALYVSPTTAETFERLSSRLSKVAGERLDNGTVLDMLISFWSCVCGTHAEMVYRWLEIVRKAQAAQEKIHV